MATPDRPPVKTEDSVRLTFYLSPAQQQRFMLQMAAAGERSVSRHIIEALGLDADEPAPLAPEA